MKHLKLFEEFEAYNEFGLQDKENIRKAKSALRAANLEYDHAASTPGGLTFFVFKDKATLDKAASAVEKVIDKSKEDEW
jgi:hypothetical protein